MWLIDNLNLTGGINETDPLNVSVALRLNKLNLEKASAYDYKDFHSLRCSGVSTRIVLKDTEKFSNKSSSKCIVDRVPPTDDDDKNRSGDGGALEGAARGLAQLSKSG